MQTCVQRTIDICPDSAATACAISTQIDNLQLADTKKTRTVTAKQIRIAGYRNEAFAFTDAIPYGGQVTIEYLRACTVFIPISGATVCIRHCTDCLFVLCCNQLRLKDCHQCALCVYSYSPPITESSSKISFHAFPGVELEKGISVNSMQIAPWQSGALPMIHFDHPRKYGLRDGCAMNYAAAKDFTGPIRQWS